MPRVARAPEPLEHESQVAVIKWARLMAGRYPELRLIYSVPNARKVTARQMAYMKAEGLLPGMWDLALPVARGGWHSLRIEMKRTTNTLTPEQKAIGELLYQYGNKTVVCYSANEAVAEIIGYLQLGVDG